MGDPRFLRDVMNALAELDGSTGSRLSLITGMSYAEIKDLGGVG